MVYFENLENLITKHFNGYLTDTKVRDVLLTMLIVVDQSPEMCVYSSFPALHMHINIIKIARFCVKVFHFEIYNFRLELRIILYWICAMKCVITCAPDSTCRFE